MPLLYINTSLYNTISHCSSHLPLPLPLPLPLRDNPLGMGGVIAKRYAELIQDLWSGHSKSITPLKFRVGKLANNHVVLGVGSI